MKLKKTLAGVAAAAVAASSLSVITFADDAATVSGEDYLAFLESIKSMSATLEVREIAPEATGEDALGFAGFYIQNKGGSWDWFACDDETTDITAPGTYEVAWTDVQSIIGETRGDKTKYKLYTPVEEWEDYPTLGIQIGSSYIKEADVEGKVDASIKGVTLELLDGTIVELGDYEAVADLKGKQEDWGISGNNVPIAFDNDVKAYIAENSKVDDPTTDDPTTDDEPKLPTTYTATLGFASGDWTASDWSSTVSIDKDGTFTITANIAPGEDGTVPPIVGATVFVIDIADLGADLGIDPDGDDYDMTKCTVSDVKVMCGDREVAVDQSKILWGDPEDKGNLRIEIFNAYGSTAVAEKYDASVSPLNPDDIACSSGEALVVSFTITGLEEALNNTTDDPTPGDSPAIDDPTTDDPTTDDPTTDDPTTDDPTTDDPTTDVPTDVDPGTSSGGNLPTGGALAVVPVALAAAALATAGIVLKKRSK